MTSIFASDGTALTLRLVTREDRDRQVEALPAEQRALAAAFEGKPGQVVRFPSGGETDAWVGIGDGTDIFALGAAPKALAGGTWRIDALPDGWDPTLAATVWGMGSYAFTLYKPAEREPASLVLPDGADGEEAAAVARSVALTRDLVNTPADRMGPEGLENAFRELAEAFDATVRVVRGDDLLAQNYPMIHAVGRAAGEAPRLLELEWGDESHPRVAVVGKGVCFDSGGLDLKSAQFMRLMKKDMGGAAHAIALAKLVMQHNLPVRLHLLVPAVENAISGNALRPGDIVKSRKGLTVEITNTDAEGRLILADALDRASEENPELLIDFATLTGAARVALGPDYPALMTRRDETAEALIAAGKAHDDEPWRLPLPGIYNEWLESSLADCVNAHKNGFAGASVAGLFLDKFVGEDIDWAHFDTYAWRPTPKPGRPKGGEAYGLRASWHMLRERFGA